MIPLAVRPEPFDKAQDRRSEAESKDGHTDLWNFATQRSTASAESGN